MKQMVSRILAVVLLGSLSGFVAGCASTDEGRESELPWNVPQTWEGSPTIPGMGGER